MWLRFALFFTALSVLLAGLNVYVYRRARRAFGLGPRGRRTLVAVLVAGAAAMLLGRALGAQLGQRASEALAVVGSTIELAVIISGGLLLLVDLARLPLRYLPHHLRSRGRHGQRGTGDSKRCSSESAGEIASDSEPRGRAERGPEGSPRGSPSGRITGWGWVGWLKKATPSPPRSGGLNRRQFALRVAHGVPLLLGSTSALYGALVGRHDYTIEDVPVRLPGLSPRLDGYTIAQLSDIHFGTFVEDAELEAAASLVRRARPDLIVLTGDLVDHDPRYADHLGRLARRLRPLARDGVVAVPGNHDYYAGIDAVLEMLRRAGARVLFNQGRVVGDRGGAFALLGVDDIWSPRNGTGPGPDLDRALGMVPPDLPRVLLCHNPAYFPEAADRVQLQLSGHTHGGQVNVGVRLADLVLPYGYVAGRYRRGESLLYVNRGFGTAGPPARIGAAPEVTRIVLTAS